MRFLPLTALCVSSVFMLSACAQNSEIPSTTTSPDTQVAEENGEESPSQSVSSDPYTFDLPVEYQSSPRPESEGNSYTDSYDLKNTEDETVVRVAIAPFVTETAHADSVKGILQAKFLFSVGSDYKTESDKEVDIKGSSESYVSPFEYKGEDEVDYGGYWWITWDNDTGRASAVEMQYDKRYIVEAEKAQDMITDSLELHPDTFTEDGPGAEF